MDHSQATGTGQSHPAQPSAEEMFQLPRRLVGDDALFLLKVHGSSMIDAEIIDGDWAIVRQRPVAESGEIVAAVIDQEVTIKRFKRINKQIWLMPENLAHIPVPGNEATILGQVVAVLRRSLLVYAPKSSLCSAGHARHGHHGIGQVLRLPSAQQLCYGR